MKTSDAEWFRRYYGDDYAASVRDLLRPERTRREVDFIVRTTGLQAGAAVADLGCGEGRHALEFARRGCAVTAVDLNPAFLDRGRRAAAREGHRVRWVLEDMRTPQPGPYNLLLLLFHSFGFFSDDENLRLLQGWRRELAAQGQLVIDVWNRARILKDFAERSQRAASPKLTVLEERAWDPSTQRLRVLYTYRWNDGHERRYDARFRLYGREEMHGLLEAAGYRLRGEFGSLEGAGWTPDAPRLVLWAEASGPE